MDACWETQLQSLPPADHSCCPLQKSSFSFVFSQQHDFYMHFMKHRHCIVVVGFFLMEILEIIKDSKTQCVCLETEKKNFSILQKSCWICMQLSELLVNGRISAVLQKQRRFDKKKKKHHSGGPEALTPQCIFVSKIWHLLWREINKQLLPRRIFTSNKWSTKLKLWSLSFVWLYFKVYRTIS